MELPPSPILRPKLAHFLWERGLVFRDVERPLGRSYEYIRQVCLPFTDPARKVPDAKFVEACERFTSGAITAADFEAPADAVAL